MMLACRNRFMIDINMEVKLGPVSWLVSVQSEDPVTTMPEFGL